MDYLTYEEYLALGGEYDESAFKRNIDHACATIDRYTQGRVEEMASVPKRVKTLCRDLIELYADFQRIHGKGIASRSETAGVVSESVTYTTQDAESFGIEVYSLVVDHLWEVTDDHGVPLLYKGVVV